MNRSLLLGAILFSSACVSIPHDDGVNDIREGVSSRTGQTVEWSAAPSTADDARIRELLRGELTADNAVTVAMVNNPRLQATLAELGIARADLLQASVVRNPLFEAEIRFPSDPFRPFELRLAQTLIDFIQLHRRRALGRAAFDAAKLRVTSDVVRFAADVRADHADLLAASQRVTQSRRTLEASTTAVELAQRQHDAQTITDLDLENQQAAYEHAKLDTVRDEQALLLARETMLRAMGIRDSSIDWQLPREFPPLPPSERDQAQLEQVASSRRLDLEIARRDADLARQRVPMARLAVIGDITLDGHLQHDASGAKTFGPGIEVPIPIFNTGAPARSRAEADYLRATFALNSLLAESASRLRAARATIAEARARVEYYRDVVVPRRQRIVELTKLEHNAMVTGVFQLLQATQNEAQARREFIDAEYDYVNARNDLDRVLNGVIDDPIPRPSTDSFASHSSRTTSPEGGH
jgi:cobalt-zinc-cadmium efflux system outer membrane protein